MLRKPYGPDAATTPIEHRTADNCPSEDSIHEKSSKCNSDNSGCTGADTAVTTLSNSLRERHYMFPALLPEEDCRPDNLELEVLPMVLLERNSGQPALEHDIKSSST